MADRLVPTSATPGAVLGDDYMDDVQDEVTGLWNLVACEMSVAGGTANDIVVTISPPLTGSLVDGMKFELTPASDNSGPLTLTDQAGKFSNVPLVDRDGNA